MEPPLLSKGKILFLFHNGLRMFIVVSVQDIRILEDGHGFPESLTGRKALLLLTSIWRLNHRSEGEKRSLTRRREAVKRSSRGKIVCFYPGPLSLGVLWHLQAN